MAGSCAWLLVFPRAGRLKRRKEGSADFGLVLSTFILFGRLKVFNNFQNFKFFFNFKNFSKVRKFCLVRKRLYKHLSVTPRNTLVSVDKFDCLSRDVKKVGKGVWWWSGFQYNSACCMYMFYFYKFDFESRLLLEILF